MRKGEGGHTLVICEKPDAARRVAEALSSGCPETLSIKGIPVFRFEDASGRLYFICAAMGHLYGIADTVRNRRVYPVLDMEWYPLEGTGKKGSASASKRIEVIRSLADGASVFINACDLDVEGETIGHNILRYACGGNEASALRARFSSLTKEEVLRAFGKSELRPAGKWANAGRLRHVLDFVWGVNVSRALSEPLRARGSFRTISMGRVQGPTLNFVVEKEVELRSFVPLPYWVVRGVFEKNGEPFEARCSSLIGPTRQAAEAVRDCEADQGIVSRVTRRESSHSSPPPFNLADLQRESFELFRYPPTKTLRIAERLYLGGIISYPRTGSQRLPRLDYGRLLSKIAAIPRYSNPAGKILAAGTFHPTEGKGLDPAHPAIYPTGQDANSRSTEERNVFDLIVRRFLSCFGEQMVREVVSANILVGRYEFTLETSRVLVPGWASLFAKTWGASMKTAPVLVEGERVDVRRVVVDERLEVQPTRYNQATILSRMEEEEIGTKATRADVISTLMERGYVSGESLVPTELGFSVVEVMREHCPELASTQMTRRMEAYLQKMEESGEVGWEFLEEAVTSVMAQVADLRLHETSITNKMGGQIHGSGLWPALVLGPCPVCKEGELRVIRSRKTGKRFVGCSGYSRGCSASAPLPQRGAIRATPRPCGKCGWPIVHVASRRRPWRLCINDRCPSKVNVYRLQKLPNRREAR